MNDPHQRAPDENDPGPASSAERGSAADRTRTLHSAGTSTPAGGVPPLPPGDLPERFGRYLIRGRLGRGGMGTVYLAHDTEIDRPVALKVPHADVARDPQALERFYREARAAGRLHHPHICPVYDVGAVDGVHFLTMAYIEGETLAALAPALASQPRRVAELVRTIALALDEAHARGVVHRDLKPSNVMVDRRGAPVVMDFGLARRAEADARTGEGVVLGTPAYMAPEQALGDNAAVGPASDVYSLGVILYELLAGRTPFVGTATAVLVEIVHGAPKPPSAHRGGVDPRLEGVCLRAMAKRPADRFPGMAAFATALDAYLKGEDGPASPPADPGADAGPLLLGLADEALRLLRTWGWYKGLEKLRAVASEERGDRPPTDLFLSWLGGDPAPLAAARERFRGLPQFPALAAWGLLGQAYMLLRAYDLPRVGPLLEEAAAQGAPPDPVLEANLDHLRGYLLLRRGEWGPAVARLHRALDLLGRDHFVTGRLLDTLGELYAGMNNFQAAREFHEQAILCKQRFDDEAGIAFSHGRLGRLYLDWGDLDRAEEHLNADLQLVQKGAHLLQAQIFEYLALAALERGRREAAAGRRPAAARQLSQAGEWQDWSIRHYRESGRPVLEAFTLKDRALVCLEEGRLDEAEGHLARAEELFRPGEVTRGLAEVFRARGVLNRAQGRHEESARDLQEALKRHDAARELAAAARTQWELARTLHAAGAMRRLVTQAYLDALRRAEACRRTDLVRAVGEELRGVDEEAHWRHVFGRVRGPGVGADTCCLVSGAAEQVSVLFLNLRGFLPFCQGMDSGDVMATLNQLMADLGTALERHRAQVTANLGGGFMALVREAGHAERAVGAALDLLKVVEDFNRPRAVLGLRQLPVKIGVASGAVCLGNVGTYHKMDYTAVGPPVNLAARLVREGDTESPCVSRETYELVRDRFFFKPDGPRVVDLKGIGPREVWEVVGRAKGSSSRSSRP
jgi:class 3 adenylate cyclase/tetratricopeptide (TPR) repeat protein/predicted Ser/Thr protein kinase